MVVDQRVHISVEGQMAVVVIQEVIRETEQRQDPF